MPAYQACPFLVHMALPKNCNNCTDESSQLSSIIHSIAHEKSKTAILATKRSSKLCTDTTDLGDPRCGKAWRQALLSKIAGEDVGVSDGYGSKPNVPLVNIKIAGIYGSSSH